jgi:hypothetical protein
VGHARAATIAAPSQAARDPSAGLQTFRVLVDEVLEVWQLEREQYSVVSPLHHLAAWHVGWRGPPGPQHPPLCRPMCLFAHACRLLMECGIPGISVLVLDELVRACSRLAPVHRFPVCRVACCV